MVTIKLIVNCYWINFFHSALGADLSLSARRRLGRRAHQPTPSTSLHLRIPVVDSGVPDYIHVGPSLRLSTWRPRIPASSLAYRYRHPWASSNHSFTARTHLFSHRASPPPYRSDRIILFPCKVNTCFKHPCKPTSSLDSSLVLRLGPTCTAHTRASSSSQQQACYLRLVYR